MNNLKDYEVRVDKGVQFLYYKGEKLPNQLKSVIVQDLEDVNSHESLCTATITVRAILANSE